MKRLKVGLYGSSGRMGKEITRVIEENPKVEIIYAPQKNTPWDSQLSAKVDVWIDFSSPEGLASLLSHAIKTKKPVVCGTTGLSIKQKKLLLKAAQKTPILWSSNMSLGVAVMIEAMKSLAAVSHFDFQIEEAHHIRKKDKPSGTAITLQENLIEVVKKKLPEPISIRGGGIFGVHKVYSMSEEEVLVFEHQALNRTVFARGAVQAAEWLAHQKKPGFYQMKDVLFSKRHV